MMLCLTKAAGRVEQTQLMSLVLGKDIYLFVLICEGVSLPWTET